MFVSKIHWVTVLFCLFVFIKQVNIWGLVCFGDFLLLSDSVIFSLLSFPSVLLVKLRDFWRWLFDSPFPWRALSPACMLVLSLVNVGIPAQKELPFSSSERKQHGCSELWDGKVRWAVTLLLYGREVTTLCLLYWPWHRSAVAYGTLGIWWGLFCWISV